ncbi:MAG: RNA pseudouridine synthase [Candidatus Rokuibacteriota bacterium]|nr:MAG: RNA pseudouridine synthase [Candidatus Rokubacteria bacterium]
MTSSRLTVGRTAAGARLDRWLAELLPDLSRSRIQHLIAGQHVTVNGAATKASHRLHGGETIEIDVPPLPPDDLVPEPIALTVLHEDDHVLVIDKPAGMVVHPGAGNATGTLAAAALAHAPAIAGVGGPRRPGIVHRLDKDTSGVLVMAKTRAAYEGLTAQLVERSVTRRYVAVVHGRVGLTAGVVDAPMGRDPSHRQRMAVRPAGKGKRAVTHYRVVERFPHFTYLELRLETGRTHQIRVHMASLGHPVVGDRTYGRSHGKQPIASEGLALHAVTLAFLHPISQKRLEFTAAFPLRLERLLSQLRTMIR